MALVLIILGKFLSAISKLFNVGHGSTWPGHIALSLNKNFIKDVLKTNDSSKRPKTVLIAGTNGKTTTGKLIRTILEQNGNTVFQNEAGANLLNGIASSLIQHSNLIGAISYDYAIFEIDENTLPLILKEINPDYLLLLNLFRDQLDRYAEVNIIVDKWKKAIEQLNNKTTLILNADDPQIAYLSLCHPELARTERSECVSGSHVFYYGLDDPKSANKHYQHAVDSTYCPNCHSKLIYKLIYYSHVGEWQCDKCGLKRPKLDLSYSPIYPLDGIYNKYNTLAAFLLAKINNINNQIIEQSLKQFRPAFGRQETLSINGKKVQIFLSKNPTSFNESLRTVVQKKAIHILLVLNDRIPDGRDVSWIWDVDFEDYVPNFKDITISGDRCFDMELRIKYAFQNQNYKSKVKIYENLSEALKKTIEQLSNHDNEVLYIMPTYSAMLEVRKILTGKKIL